MNSKSLTRGLIALPVAALVVGIAVLGSTAFGGSTEVAAPAVNATTPVASAGTVIPGLAPTTTSRDWQEVQASVARPSRTRF